MAKLMISHGGALGDNGYIVPALNWLRKIYKEIYLYGPRQASLALENTGLVDKFLIKPEEFESWSQERKHYWLVNETENMDFDASISFNGVIPGKYMFHVDDPKFETPSEWKRDNCSGVNFYDEMSKRAINFVGDNLDNIKPIYKYRYGNQAGSLGYKEQLLGKRPITRLTDEEVNWLSKFRGIYNIPDDAFILGWQWTGSARIKWYPFFDEVIQKGIMKKYPKVYVVGLGDIDNRIRWDFKYHGGRFINLGKSVSFRQAYILTSIFDCLASPETGLMVFAQGFEHLPKILLATHSYGYHFTFPETVIIQSEAECAPCYKIVYDCKHDGNNPWSLCMGKIAPAKVIEEIEKVISNFSFERRSNK